MSALSGDAERWQRVKDLLAQALELRTVPQREFIARVSEGDAPLHAELSSLVAAARSGNGELDSLPAALALEAVQARTSQAFIGRRLGRYRILSLIASGGMGEVYRAERADGQYEQHVALKVMRDGFDQAGLVARFKAERQILASLDHPNLAKVLDGGVTEEGVPYFVMELVAGEPIDVYAERMKLSIAERVQLFRSVCQVVHYAHQKGVVHRDLKVNNILVTHDGVVKLVDFGIAKRIGPDEADLQTRTATAQRVMTLVYSSPEQVRGGEITPASDIYSLGVVLYRLLTRASPYPAATADSAYELTRAICDTEPAPPSQVVGADSPGARRHLRGDLDAVVMMALRKDPQHRYASAEAFSEDLFRHLEGLPVQARRGAWSYRAGRFVLRHRAVVGAAMVANLALIAGIALASYQTWQANQQRERAERHFASVRQLANTLVVDVHQAIHQLPGSTAARKLIVDNALRYLQQLSADAKGDPALQLELATGYRHLGDIQGRSYEANLGDTNAALASYQRALDLAAPLAAAARGKEPIRRLAQRELALLHARQGQSLGSLGNHNGAKAALNASIAVTDELIAAEPADIKLQRLRATLYTELGRVQQVAGERDAFLASSARATEQFEAVLAQSPDDEVAAQNLATTHGLRGSDLLGHDPSPESARAALSEYRRGVAVLQRLVEKNPNSTPLARTLAVQHHGVGRALLRLNQPRQALEQHTLADEMFKRLAKRDPDSPQFRADQAGAAVRMSEALLAAGDTSASASTAAAAVASFEALPESVRREIVTRYLQGLAYYQLGRALDQQKQSAAACARYRQSLPIFEEMAKLLDPTDVGPDAARQALQRCA